MDSLATCLLSVASLWAVATVSPGPTFLVISQLAASRSRLAAFAAACGCGIATVVWGVCGVAGVHAIFFLAAPWTFLALKFVGAAYLLYCCISMILQSRHKAGVPAALSTRTDDVSFGTIMVLISVCWYVLVARMFSTEFVSQGYRRIGRFVDRIAGGLLVFLGLKLALDSR